MRSTAATALFRQMQLWKVLVARLSAIIRRLWHSGVDFRILEIPQTLRTPMFGENRQVFLSPYDGAKGVV